MPVNALTNSFVLGAAAGGVEWGTTIVTIITFIILLALLKKFAWGPLKEVMDKRERDINRDIDEAEEAKLNAQKLEEENKKTLKETQDEVHHILEDARIQARKQHEEIIKDAHERANGMIETAQSEIKSEKERALADINNQVSELSVLIASKVLQKEISEQDKRERDINRDIDEAEEAKLNAQKLEEENKKTLKETQDEVHHILEDARIQARKQHEEIIKDAHERANGMIETAQSEIKSEKERALADINNQVSELSVLIASKVLQKEISEQDQKGLVDKYLKEAGDK